MTVAAVILSRTPDGALADAAGRAAARRIAETAWAGGAVPIVVVCADPDGRVARSLAGSTAILAEPAPEPRGPAMQMARGMHVAADAVAETGAALIWPVQLTWVDAETVTTLIQAHGLDPRSCIRPTWQGVPGWPVLVPIAQSAAMAELDGVASPDALLAALVAATGVPVRDLDLGDPGATIGRGTPMAELPAYEGPSSPVAATPEWGSAAAEGRDDAPLEGPALAPFQPQG
jgi:CTP:molybdopterin cytidylyltransferase MocA